VGCLVKIGAPSPQRKKIGSKAVNSIFVGYAQNSVAYKFFLVHENGVFGDISESKDANFFENVLSTKTYTRYMLLATPLSVVNNASTSNNEYVEPRCSKRPRTISSFGPDCVTIFLIKNHDINYLDYFNENFI